MNIVDDATNIAQLHFEREETIVSACRCAWSWFQRYGVPVDVDTVVVSTQHTEEVPYEEIRETVRGVVNKLLPFGGVCDALSGEEHRRGRSGGQGDDSAGLRDRRGETVGGVSGHVRHVQGRRGQAGKNPAGSHGSDAAGHPHALNRPIYLPTSRYGHFGRTPGVEGAFPWEKTDLTDKLKAAF